MPREPTDCGEAMGGVIRRSIRSGNQGIAMIMVLVTIVIVTTIGFGLVGMMNADLLHASVEHAAAQSFYFAQAGLQDAEVQVTAALEPQGYTTPNRGVTRQYGGGQYTYWVDAGPAAGCGIGFKTLEALGETPFHGRTIPSRVRACGVAGAPLTTALFAVSRIELRGFASRLYLAPYAPGTAAGGGDAGSFTEIHFAEPTVHINALSEAGVETVYLRDIGPVADYTLFGFSSPPDYDPDPTSEPRPWVLGAFGDLVKAEPTTGPLPNACGTVYACVTAQNSSTDIPDTTALRSAAHTAEVNGNNMRHVYMNGMSRRVLPLLSLDAASYRTMAAQNDANKALNRDAGFPAKRDSVYTPLQFSAVVGYLARHSAETLQGVVYIDGTFQFLQSANVGGTTGTVTLAVGGDLIVGEGVPLTNRHDLSTAAGRRTPGILVFGLPKGSDYGVRVCGGQLLNGSGRLVLCGGAAQHFVVDGLVYTADGMVVGPGASVDQVGAMYHNNRGTPNPGFLSDSASVVVRFDPLALGAFGTGLAILSWQEIK